MRLSDLRQIFRFFTVIEQLHIIGIWISSSLPAVAMALVRRDHFQRVKEFSVGGNFFPLVITRRVTSSS